MVLEDEITHWLLILMAKSTQRKLALRHSTLLFCYYFLIFIYIQITAYSVPPPAGSPLGSLFIFFSIFFLYKENFKNRKVWDFSQSGWLGVCVCLVVLLSSLLFTINKMRSINIGILAKNGGTTWRFLDTFCYVFFFFGWFLVQVAINRCWEGSFSFCFSVWFFSGN